MAQEEQNHIRFGSFGTIGGFSIRSSKKPKPKPKKIPQRGLGVAQLEKIRLEEQQKNDGAAIFSSPCPLSPTKSSSYLSLQISNFHQSNQSSSSSSFPSPPPVNLSSSSSIFGPPLPVLNMALRDSPALPLLNQANSGGSESGLSAISMLEQGNALKWKNSYEHYLEKENYGVDPGLALRSNFDFFNGFNPGWPSPELMHRTQQYPSPSPMVNVPSTTSLSSGLNYQIEPPSNQSYYYGNYSTIWADKEEKIYDHRWESLHSKYRELDRAWSSLQYPSAPSSFENINEDDFHGNFLSLTSLATCWTCPSSNNIKYPPTYPPLENLMHQSSESPSFQGGTRPSGLDEKQPFYSFFPAAEAKIGQEIATSMNRCNWEVGEKVDLDLKL